MLNPQKLNQSQGYEIELSIIYRIGNQLDMIIVTFHNII
jgi:hypothetical protein